MATENFTTYDEVDPDSDITVAASTLTIDTMECDQESHVSDDKGIDHFDGNYEHLVDYNMTLQQSYTRVCVWALTNTIDGFYQLNQANDDAHAVQLWKDTGSGYCVLRELIAGVLYSDNYVHSLSTDYYLEVERDEAVGTYGTLYCRIYSDAPRTTLVDTLTVTLHEKEDWRHIFGVLSEERPGYTYDVSLTVSNLDLQEGDTYTLLIGSGTFNLTGQTVDLLFGRSMSVGSGTFTLTGADTDLLFNQVLTVGSGTFNLAGTDVDLLFNRMLSIDSGSFALTGSNVDLLFNRVLPVDSGAFVLTGADVTLIYSGAADYILTTESGSFILTGQAVDLLFNRSISIGSGTYALAGQDVSLLFNRVLPIDSGTYTVTGQDTGLLFNRVLPVDPGAYSLSGQSLDLLFNRVLSADSGTFTLTGADVALLAHKVLSIGSGSFILTGQDVALTWSGLVLPVGPVVVTFIATLPGIALTSKQPGVTLSAKQPSITVSAQ